MAFVYGLKGPTRRPYTKQILQKVLETLKLVKKTSSRVHSKYTQCITLQSCVTLFLTPTSGHIFYDLNTDNPLLLFTLGEKVKFCSRNTSINSNNQHLSAISNPKSGVNLDLIKICIKISALHWKKYLKIL